MTLRKGLFQEKKYGLDIITMTNQKFNSLFNGTPRKPEEPITQNHMDIAASIQNVIEEIILKICL